MSVRHANRRRERLRALAALAAAAAIFLGCSRFLGTKSRASLSGVAPDRVRAALASDPELRITREFPEERGSKQAGGWWFDRQGASGDVFLTRNPDEVRVSVLMVRDRERDGIKASEEQAAAIREILSRAVPEIGPWEVTVYDGGELWTCFLAPLGLAGAVAAAVLVERRKRRLAARAAEPGPAR